MTDRAQRESGEELALTLEHIEGNLLSVKEEDEPWEYHTTLTEKEVTGWLRDAVLRRVGKSEGRVTSIEDSTSTGTCEVCGGYSEYITLYVDGTEVYTGGDSGPMDYGDNELNPFTELQKWLGEQS